MFSFCGSEDLVCGREVNLREINFSLMLILFTVLIAFCVSRTHAGIYGGPQLQKLFAKKQKISHDFTRHIFKEATQASDRRK